jgi:hypothetical protein
MDSLTVVKQLVVEGRQGEEGRSNHRVGGKKDGRWTL